MLPFPRMCFLAASVCVALSGKSLGGITQNLLKNPGFEDGPETKLTETALPWFTVGNATSGSSCYVIASHAHGGEKSAVFKFYFSQDGIAQNTGCPIEHGMAYEISLWMLIDEPAEDSRFTAVPAATMSIWSSPEIEGTYKYRAGAFGNTPAKVGEWQRFSTVIPAKRISEWEGEYIQVRVSKSNGSVSHRIFIDDVEFGVTEAATPAKIKKPNATALRKKENGNLKTKPVRNTSPYTRWAFSHGLEGPEALPTANPDGDVLNNLYEYGLGGNPTDGNDFGMSPIYGELDESGSNCAYIYPRRIDAKETLTYRLERNGKAVGNDECEEVNTSSLSDEYDAVVMRISPEIKRKQDLQLKLILDEGSVGENK